jgi:hypothetical protein
MTALNTARVPGCKMNWLPREYAIRQLGGDGTGEKIVDLGFELALRASTLDEIVDQVGCSGMVISQHLTLNIVVTI